MLRYSLIPVILLASVAHAAPLTLGVVLDQNESFTDQATTQRYRAFAKDVEKSVGQPVRLQFYKRGFSAIKNAKEGSLDMVFGCYYLTTLKPGARGEGHAARGVFPADVVVRGVGHVPDEGARLPGVEDHRRLALSEEAGDLGPVQVGRSGRPVLAHDLGVELVRRQAFRGMFLQRFRNGNAPQMHGIRELTG